jgi:hypothetical protein
MLIEHLKKIAIAWQQLAKEHGGLLKATSQLFDDFVTMCSLTAALRPGATPSGVERTRTPRPCDKLSCAALERSRDLPLSRLPGGLASQAATPALTDAAAAEQKLLRLYPRWLARRG